MSQVECVAGFHRFDNRAKCPSAEYSYRGLISSLHGFGARPHNGTGRTAVLNRTAPFRIFRAHHVALVFLARLSKFTHMPCLRVYIDSNYHSAPGRMRGNVCQHLIQMLRQFQWYTEFKKPVSTKTRERSITDVSGIIYVRRFQSLLY